MKMFFIITTLLLSSCSNIQFGWDKDCQCQIKKEF